MMGGPAGHAPGRVVEFDKNLQVVREYPEQPPADGFNPHGISVRRDVELMVTSDYLCPSRPCMRCRCRWIFAAVCAYGITNGARSCVRSGAGRRHDRRQAHSV